MPVFLSQRDTNLTELMDDPYCDYGELKNTYRQFSVINSLVSRWHFIYKHYMYPCLDKKGNNTILDVGFGGGDIPIKLSQWINNDGLKAKITAIDTDARAYDYVRHLETPGFVTFKNISLRQLSEQGETFDIIVSNHLLHHLDNYEFYQLLEDSVSVSRKRILFNDIERSDLGYLLFNVFSRPIFRSSFITRDGLTSIRRSYTFEELKEKVPGEWEVSRIFPYRLLLSYSHE